MIFFNSKIKLYKFVKKWWKILYNVSDVLLTLQFFNSPLKYVYKTKFLKKVWLNWWWKTYLKLVLVAAERSALFLPEVVRLDDVRDVHGVGEVLLQDLQDGLDRGPGGAAHVYHNREPHFPHLLPTTQTHITLSTRNKRKNMKNNVKMKQRTTNLNFYFFAIFMKVLQKKEHEIKLFVNCSPYFFHSDYVAGDCGSLTVQGRCHDVTLMLKLWASAISSWVSFELTTASTYNRV